ncbi:hypothetical protein Pint_19359 [Pistacia integerrima]|uniref:Uncharacterized protein n=1 Tax=Pistacia integerrima TaxID=434235 RepID=A0ACC0Z010_9ROSI|nr:hypothetical protein Pint_19359 [Pistacia integerrima]
MRVELLSMKLSGQFPESFKYCHSLQRLDLSGKIPAQSGWCHGIVAVRFWALVVRLRDHKLVQVSLFQEPLVKLKLADLTEAANIFVSEKVIIYVLTGTTYKVELPDGSMLAIKTAE